MTGKLILLLPHYYNLNLRLINQQILDNMPVYVHPNESECKPPDDLVDIQGKWEPLPPPDS